MGLDDVAQERKISRRGFCGLAGRVIVAASLTHPAIALAKEPLLGEKEDAFQREVYSRANAEREDATRYVLGKEGVEELALEPLIYDEQKVAALLKKAEIHRDYLAKNGALHLATNTSLHRELKGLGGSKKGGAVGHRSLIHYTGGNPLRAIPWHGDSAYHRFPLLVDQEALAMATGTFGEGNSKRNFSVLLPSTTFWEALEQSRDSPEIILSPGNGASVSSKGAERESPNLSLHLPEGEEPARAITLSWLYGGCAPNLNEEDIVLQDAEGNDVAFWLNTPYQTTLPLPTSPKKEAAFKQRRRQYDKRLQTVHILPHELEAGKTYELRVKGILNGEDLVSEFSTR